jgi:hypothetical protein
MPIVEGSVADILSHRVEEIVEMKQFALAAIIALSSLTSWGTASAEAQDGLAIPLTGTSAGGAFAGTFTLTRFVSTADGLGAVGTLTGTLTTTAGESVSVARNITLPAVIGNATCDILHLDLGPLSLDLLGLQVDLSRIVLDITAQTGAGNLLGNLLCGVTALLDNPSGLAKLLNQILSLLG